MRSNKIAYNMFLYRKGRGKKEVRIIRIDHGNEELFLSKSIKFIRERSYLLRGVHRIYRILLVYYKIVRKR
jgi:hypothetical protein